MMKCKKMLMKISKKMKKVLFFALLLMILGAASVNAQVRVGENASPRAGAILDLKSSSYFGGLLLPNIEITDPRKIPDTFTDAATIPDRDNCPELTGLLVWNTHSGDEGVYMWNGADWEKLKGGNDGSCSHAQVPHLNIVPRTDGVVKGGKIVWSMGELGAVLFYIVTPPPAFTSDSGISNSNNFEMTANKVMWVPPHSFTVTEISYCGNVLGQYKTGNGFWVVPETAVIPVGMSTGCSWLEPEKCVCSKGTRKWFNELTAEQRDGFKISFTKWIWDMEAGGYAKRYDAKTGTLDVSISEATAFALCYE
jgi:hypothetical protein